MSVAGECFFLDVGQGTCQVIVLQDGSAIVIDCGPSYDVLGDLLKRRLNVGRIKLLLISHNHSDHIGGLPDLLRNFRKSIDEIQILQDKPAKDLLAKNALKVLVEESGKKNCPEPAPLYRSTSNLMLYESSNAGDSLRLELLFPSLLENLQAQTGNDQNRSSGVLLLHCGKRRILFPGDAEINAWNTIYENRGRRPIECDVAAVPHHGGQIVRQKKSNETQDAHYADIKSDLTNLYRDIIRSKIGIVSVGTDFQHEHPIPPHIEAIRDAGTCIMCTQITQRCCTDLESLRPGILDQDGNPRRSSRNTDLTNDGRSKNVACAGTILVQISPDIVTVLRHQEHQLAITKKLTKPLCRIIR